MSAKQYCEFQYLKKEDYNKKLKINGEELPAYSKKKLKKLYRNADRDIIGETFEKKKRDRKKDIGRIELNEKRLNVGEPGKHNKFFKKQAAFVEVEGGGFIVLLKTRILAILLIFAILLGGIGGGVYHLLKENRTVPSGGEIDPNIKPVETEILTVSGMVTKNLKGVEGVVLSLQSGNTEIASATTDKDGKYLISDVENGNYNLVCTYGESVLTEIATVNSMSIVVNFTFPADDLHDVEDITDHHDKEDLPDSKETDEKSDVRAIVRVTDAKTPPVAVGGLSKEAILNMVVGKEVDITFLATLLEGNEIPAADKAAIEELSGELTLRYYDFSVMKEIFKNKKLESSEYLKSTKTVLEIAVPHDSSKAVGTYVFRYHSGAALRLEELKSKPTGVFTDGTYFVTADTVYIYTNCFSTYAIGSAYTDQIVRGSDTITYSDKATVNLKTKEISMLYRHDRDSTNSVRIEMYLVGNNGNLLISESGIIPVGYQLEKMILKNGIRNMPSVGTYNGLMRIIYIGTAGDTDTNVEIPLNIAITQ